MEQYEQKNILICENLSHVLFFCEFTRTYLKPIERFYNFTLNKCCEFMKRRKSIPRVKEIT